MRLGIFDSGLGGLLIARAIHEAIPDIDKIYMGDTLNLPYGSRSETMVYDASKRCIKFLFEQDCALVIIACNTSSARALGRLQQEFLPDEYPERRILGVVVPTIEEAVSRQYDKISMIGTNYTVQSHIYRDELQKINPNITLIEKRTPLLVPLIENDGEPYIANVLDDYLDFLTGNDSQALLLGCTHYIHLKNLIRSRVDIDVLSQDEIIPDKLRLYLKNHPEIGTKLTRNGDIQFYVSDLTQTYVEKASDLFQSPIIIQHRADIHG
ncbi:MAG: glutamate racemase [Bdellovibrionales bacterium]